MSGGGRDPAVRWADESGRQSDEDDQEQQNVPENELHGARSGSVNDRGNPQTNPIPQDITQDPGSHGRLDVPSNGGLFGDGIDLSLQNSLAGSDAGPPSALMGTPNLGSQELTASGANMSQTSIASRHSNAEGNAVMSPVSAYFSPLPSFEVAPLQIPPVDPDTHCAIVTPRVLLTQNPGGDLLDIPYVQETELLEEQVAPSVFKFATAAYISMCHTKKDQVVLAMGYPGSGKKESTKLIIEQLAFLSSERTRKNPSLTKPEVNVRTLEDKINPQALNSSNVYASTMLETDDVDSYYALFLKAHNLLEAFGCEETKLTPNQSRFGLFSEMHFAQDGILLGAKFMEYAPSFSQGLHIFKFLLQGATDDEVEYYRLEDIPDACPATSATWAHPYFESGGEALAQIRGLLTELGISKHNVQQELLCLVAAILHLSNLSIREDTSKRKYGSQMNAEAVMPGDVDHLEFIADELLGGIDVEYLWNLISSRTVIIGGSYCTEYNSYEQALGARDQLVQCLYVHLFDWLVTSINRRLSKEASCAMTIGILSFPGLMEDISMGRPIASPEVWTHQFANEQILKRAFDGLRSAKEDGDMTPTSPDGVEQAPNLGEFMEEITRDIEYAHFEVQSGEEKLASALKARYQSDDRFVTLPGCDDAKIFGLKHILSGEGVTTAYNAPSLLKMTGPYMPPAIAATLQKSYNRILAEVFSLDAIQATNDPVRFTHLGSRQRAETQQWKRTVSTMDRRKNRKFNVKKKTEEEKRKEQSSKLPPLPSNLNVYFTRLNELFEGIQEHTIWGLVCTKSQPSFGDAIFVDHEYYERQLGAWRLLSLLSDERDTLIQHQGFPEILAVNDFKLNYMGPIQYQQPSTYLPTDHTLSEEEKMDHFLATVCRKAREDHDVDPRKIVKFDKGAGRIQLSRMGAYVMMVTSMQEDTSERLGRRKTMRVTLSKPKSQADATTLPRPGRKDEEKAKKEPIVYRTSQRKWWMYITTCLTFWVPDKCLRFGGKATDDIRIAWREKVALNILILVLSMILIFFIAFFSQLLCPPASLFTMEELATHNSKLNKAFFMSWNGNVYDLTDFPHPNPQGYDQGNHYDVFGGQDVSHMFPRYDAQANAWPEACTVTSSPILAKRQSNTTFQVNPRCASTDHPDVPGYCHVTGRIDNLIEGGVFAIREVGNIAYGYDVIVSKTTNEDTWVVMDDNIYFISDILEHKPPVFNNDTLSILSGNRGQDMTEFKDSVAAVRPCLDTIAFIGKVDIRSRFSCIFASYFLLATTAGMLLVVLVKFLAALQLGAKKQPEDIDKYVILQVPCYTEDEGSIRKTINSLALTNYDDMRKLLLIVCDGMIRGSGNSLATPEIVLSILGVPPEKYRDDPEPALSYLAIGEGKKQHNRGRVYSGFYNLHGRQIPYLVVVKCGAEGELHRPGNRGKRDSQMVLMRFMNHVIMNSPMTPMDLDLYEKIRQLMGVEPYEFEYSLMVDADTEVMPDSLTRLIAFCMGDRKIMGISGETGISNEKQSFVTMIQVFEYWISHHLNKAFESLFGTVTCLPGCFCMYRLRTSSKKNMEPILCHSDIISEYSTCTVDTLHEKNLLHLGEDRYLTTLMLKNFPDKKNKFIPDAKCLTVVPDTFDVLLSQRRRWINSTIHNLFELLFVNQLCGCLIFSMRAIIALDLFATLVMPASVIYAGYILYLAIAGGLKDTVTLIMLGMIYGLQMLLFIVKRQWQHFGWMIMHIISLPVFYCYIPLYSFWHFDDFSWGNTRVIAGESKVAKGHGEGDAEDKFDPSEIPLMSIKEYREKRRQHFLSGEVQKSVYHLSGTQQPGLGVPQATGMKGSRSMIVDSALLSPVPIQQANPKGSQSLYAGTPMGSPTMLAPTPSWLKKSRSARGSLADDAGPVSVQPGAYPSVPNSPPGVVPTLQVNTQFDRGSAVSINMSNARGEGEPSNEEMVELIREQLGTMDHSTVSKQKVRVALEERLGMSLHHRRGFISDAVEMLLHGPNV